MALRNAHMPGTQTMTARTAATALLALALAACGEGPKDIQFAKGNYFRPNTFHHQGYKPKLDGDPNRIKQAVEMMIRAKRPVFYTGGGIINAGPQASKLLR